MLHPEHSTHVLASSFLPQGAAERIPHSRLILLGMLDAATQQYITYLQACMDLLGTAALVLQHASDQAPVISLDSRTALSADLLQQPRLSLLHICTW